MKARYYIEGDRTLVCYLETSHTTDKHESGIVLKIKWTDNGGVFTLEFELFRGRYVSSNLVSEISREDFRGQLKELDPPNIVPMSMDEKGFIYELLDIG